MGGSARLRDKHAKRFDMFDSNGDGVVRQRDLAGLAERLVRRFRVPGDSVGAERVRAAYEMLWLSLLAACGVDGQVTRAGFVAALGAGDLARRVGAADVVAIRECGATPEGIVDIEHVAEIVVALGAHPGDAPLIREALKPDGKLLPMATVERLVAGHFTDDAPSGLYGR
ncbi:hypothetical protein [Saccharothrix algeriensis]|uniref:EF-hand domain-containing protein n=1 Tax=Saccharothrix algeriensis TaxID=173560 RepID=A0A8T8I184_9PSEU|nr:hypothetical protein [Saccharothrix algeriensis]MBM7810259.1 hypothetical protein [Saccharothrix algeriensis]QTR04419.1 hypothetical protein J7S33_05880 [Saccharothrix algeriensis]